MKKLCSMLFFLVAFAGMAMAQEKQAEIKFEKTTLNAGTFSENDPIQKYVFKFKNVGDAPLVINQAMGSCGCTVPSYTKKPIAPGAEGELKVTYNGRGKFPGHFKKNITVRTNGKTELTRLYIEGTMEEVKPQ